MLRSRGTRALVVLAAAALLAAAGGCTTYTKVNTGQVKEFRRDIRSQYKQIRDVHVRFNPTLVEILFTFRQAVEEDEVKAIFARTKTLVQSRKFREQVIGEKYFAKYSKNARIYPNIAIDFDLDRDGNAEYRHTSSYYVHGRAAALHPADPETDIDGYKTWYYRTKENVMPEPVTDG
jgi:hypothetical protein